MSDHFVYKLIDIKANKVFYVGRSQLGKRRFIRHKNETYNKKQKEYNYNKSVYIRSITTSANFDQDVKEVIIKDKLTKNEAILEEYREICKYENLMNEISGLSRRTINDWFWDQLTRAEKQHFFERDACYSSLSKTLINLNLVNRKEATDLYINSLLTNGFYYGSSFINCNINLLIENNKLPKELIVFISSNNKITKNASEPIKYKILINKVSTSKLPKIGEKAIDISDNKKKQINMMTGIGLINYINNINNKFQWNPKSSSHKIRSSCVRSGIYELEFI